MTAAPSAFDLHGVGVAVTGEPALAAAATERLAALPAAADADAVVAISFAAEPPASSAGNDHGGRVVYESRFGAVRYTPDDDELRLDADGLGLCCRCGAGEAAIWVDPAREDALWLASRPMLSVVLFELLRRHELYVLHAAAAAVGSHGLVLVGDSGRGKSTLALALARAEQPLLGDDLVFLSPERDGGVVLRGFPEPVDMGGDAARLFPELPALRGAPPPGWPKHRVPIDVFGAAPAPAAVPSVVVFLDPPGRGRSRLEPLAEADALLRLVPSIFLTQAERSQRHLDALGRLVATTRSYRLRAGDDPAEAAAALVDLVAAG